MKTEKPKGKPLNILVCGDIQLQSLDKIEKLSKILIQLLRNKTLVRYLGVLEKKKILNSSSYAG